MLCRFDERAIGISGSRTFCLPANTRRAASSKPGAISTSTNCLATCSAAAPSSGRLNAMIPPKADVGSVAKAFAYASPQPAPIATPHGFACLTITHAASSKVFTRSHAASESPMLLYESSLPCSCR